MPEENVKIKECRAVFTRYPVLVAYLFGSRATGRINKASDYDFAVLLSEKISPDQYFDYKLALLRELLKVVKAEFIDLVILNDRRAPLLLKYNIVKDGIIIYEKDKKARVNLEFEIMRDWLDWQYFENLWQTIFIKNLAQGKFL